MRNQRIVEKQIREGQRREKEWRETYFEVVAPDGRVLKVWAQPSGYPFRFEGTGDWPDIILMPFYLLVPWLLNRYWHRRGWSVAVLAPRRWVEKRLLLERFDSKEAAKTRAAELAASLGQPR